MGRCVRWYSGRAHHRWNGSEVIAQTAAAATRPHTNQQHKRQTNAKYSPPDNDETQTFQRLTNSPKHTEWAGLATVRPGSGRRVGSGGAHL